MNSLLKNTQGSAIPLILFIGGVIITGALYSVFFIVVGFPALNPIIPNSIFKTVIIAIIAFSPLVVLFIGVISLIIQGIKQSGYSDMGVQM